MTRQTGKKYQITNIPPDFWRRVNLCAEIEQTTIREKLMEFLRGWVAEHDEVLARITGKD